MKYGIFYNAANKCYIPIILLQSPIDKLLNALRTRQILPLHDNILWATVSPVTRTLP